MPLRLNNLPSTVTKGDMEGFLFGLEFHAIELAQFPGGNCNMEAFVQLLIVEDAVQALDKQKKPLNGKSGLVSYTYYGN